jgi:hypothetical protein
MTIPIFEDMESAMTYVRGHLAKTQSPAADTEAS